MNLRSFTPDRISLNAKMFLAAMVLSGLGDGVIMVVGQLYLVSMGFESAALGTMVMWKPMGTVLLCIPAGVLADRYGRAKVLLFGLVAHTLALFIILTTTSPETLSLAFLLVGFGDATFVVLSPLFSSFFDREDMDRAFGLRFFLNAGAISLASLLGFVPPMLVARYGFSTQASYWTMMLLATVFVLVRMPLYMLATRGLVQPTMGRRPVFNLVSRGVVAKFCLLAIIGQAGFAIFLNLVPFYVNKKFGVESDAPGTLSFISTFTSAGAAIIGPRISRRLGTLGTIVASIALCPPLFLLIAMAPSFLWLSVFYVVRVAAGGLSSPLGPSLYMRLLNDHEKVTATSLTMMAGMGGTALATWLGGQLMEKASLDLPAYLAAALYVVSAASHYLLLRNEKGVGVRSALL